MRRLRKLLVLGAMVLCLCQVNILVSLAYSFEAEGVEISMNQDVEDVLDDLGKADNFYEADSCNYQGKEKVFTYKTKGFQLFTYPLGENDFIMSVWFLGTEAITPEGIGIGSTISEMKEVYGEDYEEVKGKYTYTTDAAALTFYTRKGLVDGVEYKAVETEK